MQPSHALNPFMHTGWLARPKKTGFHLATPFVKLLG